VRVHVSLAFQSNAPSRKGRAIISMP
jgi:hypothetical protein